MRLLQPPLLLLMLLQEGCHDLMRLQLLLLLLLMLLQEGYRSLICLLLLPLLLLLLLLPQEGYRSLKCLLPLRRCCRVSRYCRRCTFLALPRSSAPIATCEGHRARREQRQARGGPIQTRVVRPRAAPAVAPFALPGAHVNASCGPRGSDLGPREVGRGRLRAAATGVAWPSTGATWLADPRPTSPAMRNVPTMLKATRSTASTSTARPQVHTQPTAFTHAPHARGISRLRPVTRT